MADDNLSADYLTGREAATAAENVRFLQGMVGGTETPADAAATVAAAPKAEKKVEAEDRTKKGTVLGGLATQAVGGARDAVVQGGKAIEDMTAWLREHTPLGELPVGPKVQVKLPTVRKPEGVAEEVTRGASQFLTGFIPFFKATRGAGLGVGASGAVAGAVTDFTVFDPNDPRVSNLVNELAPALRTPLTDYLAADPNDSAAEGRFKNVLEGLALGGLAEGVFRAAKVLKTARGMGKEELRAAVTSERGAVGAEAQAAAAGGEAPKVTPLVQVKSVTPEQAREFMTANPDALNLGDRVLKVGWEQIGDQAGLEEVINRTTNAFRQNVEVARRGKISDENLRVLARELEMPVEEFLGRRVGAALNAEQTLSLVSLLGGSAKRLRGLADQVAAGNLDARQAMLDQLSLHAAIQEQAFGARAESGRALRVWGMQADGTIAHSAKLAQAAQELTGIGGSALDAERLAHMIITLDSPAKVAKMTREATKPGWADMASEYWINALLSGPQTHAANFLSNTLTTLWAVPERALAAQLSPRGQGVVSGEATAMLSGLVGGTWDAVRIAGKALRDGVPVREGSKVESFTRKAISGANMGLSGDMGRAIDLLGTAVRTPGRFLMASDEFFKAVNFRMELNAQAVRQASSEGLSGKAAGTRVAALLQDPDFLKRVKPLADEFADYQTFTKPLGETGSAIAAFRDSHPAAKLVVPFIRTPVNIFKYVGERTPFLNRLSSEVRADIAAGGARGDMARAKVQLGGMVMASTTVLASSGYVTGRGPRDPNLRREWLETNQPYSVKIGGTWHSYNRLDPIGSLLGMAADFADLAGDLDEIDASQLSAAMALSVSNNMLSKTYLTGLADTLEAIQSPTQDAAKAMLKLAGTVVPTGVAQVARTMDPTVREVNSVYDAIVARVPGYSSTLPAKMNLWAEPIKLSGGLGPDLFSPIYTKTPELKPVSEEMQRLQISVGMPGKWIFGKPMGKDPLTEPSAKDGVPLEPKEYEQYVKLAAGRGLGSRMPLLKDALQKLIESDTYKRQSEGLDGGKAMLIKDRINAYRNAAQAKLIAESPELRAQLMRKTMQRGEALRPQGSLIPNPAQVQNRAAGVGDMLKDLPSTLGR